jgi:phospholipid-transporting ATPase
MQAALNSDYAIAQFKYLQNLLLVHGRWSYKRMARLVLYSFYKNITLSLCMFWFGIYTKYTAQNLFESWSLSCYNVIFTSIPIMVYSIFDKDINVPNSLATPELYVEGQRNIEFGIKILWGWLTIGLWNSLVIFFGMIFYFGDSVIDNTGQSHGIWSFGVISYTVVIVVVNLKVAVETNYWTALSWITIIGSILAWFLFALTYSAICSVDTMDMCGIAQKVYRVPTYWLLVIVLAIICLIPDFTYKYWQRNYFPRPSQVAQEIQRAKRKSRKLEKRFPMVKQEVSNVSMEHVKKQNFTGFAFSAEEQGSISGALQASVSRLMQIAKKKEDRIRVELELEHPDDPDQTTDPRKDQAQDQLSDSPSNERKSKQEVDFA